MYTKPWCNVGAAASNPISGCIAAALPYRRLLLLLAASGQQHTLHACQNAVCFAVASAYVPFAAELMLLLLMLMLMLLMLLLPLLLTYHLHALRLLPV
jgi:hypothetical protein